LQTAKQHEATTLYLLQTVPGMGTILRLVLLYAIHDLARFPSVQDVASYGRLVTCATASGGKRLGTSGQKIGHAHLQWAFAEAAGQFRRTNEPGHKILARLEQKHDKGTALSILAHALGRAVSYRLKCQTAGELERFQRASESRAGEPGASLDTQGGEPAGSSRAVLVDGVFERQGAPRPFLLAPDALLGRPRWLLDRRPWAYQLAWAAPPPSPRLPGACKRLSQT
jgi:transposase